MYETTGSLFIKVTCEYFPHHQQILIMPGSADLKFESIGYINKNFNICRLKTRGEWSD